MFKPAMHHETNAPACLPLTLPTVLCPAEDPLLGLEQTTVTEGRERSVLGQARKNLFTPRTFGQGEDGECT